MLDLLLKHVKDEIFGCKTWSPNINYFFVDELIKNYDDLVKNFKLSTSNISIPAMVWQDDMKFLCELGHHYRYYFEEKDFAKINFKALLNISNARWNSRGILALLAFFFIARTLVATANSM